MKKGSRADTWSDDQLEAAMKEVFAGRAGVKAATRKYGIPRSSLHDHLSGKSTKRHGGPRTVLTPAIEKEIATTCIVLQEFDFPLSKELLGVIIHDLLNDNGQENPPMGPLGETGSNAFYAGGQYSANGSLSAFRRPESLVQLQW